MVCVYGVRTNSMCLWMWITYALKTNSPKEYTVFRNKFIIMHDWLSEQFTGMPMVYGFIEFCSIIPSWLFHVITDWSTRVQHIAYDA